ncbi:MAG: D-alanine--D-alanine ligase [Clostridiales bacterium]|nr:D-alanine--D-alanine ligase [Clostridiales bacterium]
MKIKLAVMFGGKSVEHEISIISAIQAMGYLNKEKYEVIPIYITKSNEMYVGENIGKIEAYKDIKGLLSSSQRVTLVYDNGRVNIIPYPSKLFSKAPLNTVDVAFPVVHGTNVEDGTLQGYLKMLNLPYVGCDVLSSAVGMDKYVMKTVLKDNDIPVLDCRCFSAAQYNDSPENIIEIIEGAFEYPVIVKPINLGSSIGISKADSRKELSDALDLAFEFAGKILVEPAISNLREINCSVLGNSDKAEASECEEPVNTDKILSYEDKYINNAKGSSKGMASVKRKIPAELSPEMREEIRSLAVKAFKVLGCGGVSRIDFMIDADTNKVWLNEINTIPGSLSFYLWEPVGVKYTELLDRMIDLALERQRKDEDITYSFDTNVLSGVKLGGTKGKLKV